MYPSMLGLPSQLWLGFAATAFGIGDALCLARRAGFSTGRAARAIAILSLTAVAGTKLLFVVERFLTPGGAALRGNTTALSSLLVDGFRLPGGVVLAASVFPLVCRVLRLPALRFGDAVAPALGTAVVFIRSGCLLAGCCFGRLAPWPLGVRFPAGSVVHSWHTGIGIIGPMEPYSAPVYPLQLWFAVIGIGLRLLGAHWQRVKRFDGEVLSKVGMAFFATTALMEFFRGYWLPLNVALAAVAAAGYLAFLLSPRLPAGRGAHART